MAKRSGAAARKAYNQADQLTAKRHLLIHNKIMTPHQQLKNGFLPYREIEQQQLQDHLIENDRIRSEWSKHPITQDYLNLLHERKNNYENMLSRFQSDKDAVYQYNLKLQELKEIVEITQGKLN